MRAVASSCESSVVSELRVRFEHAGRCHGKAPRDGRSGRYADHRWRKPVDGGRRCDSTSMRCGCGRADSCTARSDESDDGQLTEHLARIEEPVRDLAYDCTEVQ